MTMCRRWEKWNIISDTQLKARSFGSPNRISYSAHRQRLLSFGPVAAAAIFVMHTRNQGCESVGGGVMCHQEEWKTALAGQQQELSNSQSEVWMPLD